MADGNNNNDDDAENNHNNDDNATINEEDEQGSVNGPPQLESSIVRMDFNNADCNVDFDYPIYRLLHVEGQPVILFTDAKAEEMAFPCLFPNGVNGFLTARDPAIN